MKAIVFVGHGELPLAIKHSVEMISGKNERLYAVSLAPEDGKEQYAHKLAELDASLEKYESVLVFADLMGGSPSNAAVEKYLNMDHVAIISGMNLPMVLTAVMSDLPNEFIISEGIEGIKDVKLALNPATNDQRPESVEVTPQPGRSSAQSTKKKEGKPFEIKNVRVDARGIHGQVATAWVPKLEVDRIIVIDDSAVKDDVQKMALKMAKPNSVKLSILSSAKAVERLKDSSAYPDEAILVIVQKIETLATLSKLGYQFPTVNMGNVPNRPGTQAFRKTVSLTADEINIVNDLIGKGTHFTAQMVPNDPIVDFDKLIQA